jgi:2'-hydroxyisoflavone reductase
MRILVVGGTRFVGRALVEPALAAGHDVTLLHRGSTPLDGFDGAVKAEHLLADRDDDAALAAALAGRAFDATVDTCAYTPYAVTSLASALGGKGGHHLYVSTVSVYAPPGTPGYTESAPLLEPAARTERTKDMSRYGELKVACELEAAALHGDGMAIVRPTYVVGPYDYTWRFPWWVHRIAQGGEVLCPGPYEEPAQVIDARDQGTFMLGLLERGVAGTFHTVSPRPPFSFGQMLDAIALAVAPAGTTLRWVDPQDLVARKLPESSLPLWAGEDDELGSWLSAADPSAAYDAGLTPRPLVDTVRDTAAWIATTDGPPAGTGLSPAQESEILTAT